MRHPGLRNKAVVAGVLTTLAAAAVVATGAQASDEHAPVQTVPDNPDHRFTGLDLSKITPKEKQTFSTVGRPQSLHRYGKGLKAAPNSFSLESSAPSAGNQGEVGSCVTWALAYSAYGSIMQASKIPNAPMAPMYLYSQIAAKNGGDHGTFGREALDIAVKEGIAPRSAYGNENAAYYDWHTQPTSAQRAEAGKYKLSGYTNIPVTGGQVKQQIMDSVANGMPVIIGARVYSNFRNLDAATAKDYSYRGGSGFLGGHEMTIIGYDERGVRIQNSWGGNWGDNGRVNWSWEYLLNSGDLMDAQAVGKVVYTGGDAPAPQPTGTATDPQPTGTDPAPTTTDPAPTTPQPTTDVPSHVEVTSSNWEQVKQSSFTRPLVLDFGATWCGACQSLKPRIEALNKAAGGKWTLGAVDVDKNPTLPKEYNATAYPTVVMLWKGKEIDGTRFVGALGDSEITQKIDKALAAAGSDPAPTTPAPTTTGPTSTDPMPTGTEPAPGPGPQPTSTDPTPPQPTDDGGCDDGGCDDGGCPGDGGCDNGDWGWPSDGGSCDDWSCSSNGRGGAGAYYYYWNGHLYFFDGRQAWVVN